MKTLIRTSAEFENIIIGRIDEVGNLVDASGSIIIALPDLLGSDSVNHVVKLRELGICDPATGATKRAIFLVSEPF